MNRTLISLAIAAALASPAIAETGDGSDDSGISAIGQLDDGLHAAVAGDGSGAIVTDNSVESIGAKASDGSAASTSGSAYVDNGTFLSDSALTSTELGGTISHNAVQVNDNAVVVNKVDGRAFKDARGVSQVSQNGGQNSLVQQSLTIQANVKADRRTSP